MGPLLKEVINYQLEVSLNYHLFLGQKPSTMAVAAILNSILRIPSHLMSMKDIESLLLSITESTCINVMSCEMETLQNELLACVEEWMEKFDNIGESSPRSLLCSEKKKSKYDKLHDYISCDDLKSIVSDDSVESLNGVNVDKEEYDKDNQNNNSPTAVSQTLEDIEDHSFLIKKSTPSNEVQGESNSP